MRNIYELKSPININILFVSIDVIIPFFIVNNKTHIQDNGINNVVIFCRDNKTTLV